MIVSNPPYIAPDDPHLQRGDLRFEPAEALAAAEDGLADLKAIIRQAPSYLQRDGLLVLEHGYNQAQSVAALLQAQGFIDIQLACDSDALPRISSAVWPGE
jgi:release factor glutamine methyltransferase